MSTKASHIAIAIRSINSSGDLNWNALTSTPTSVSGYGITDGVQEGDSVTLTGDVTGTSTFNTSGNASIATTVVNNSHTHNGSTIDANSISASELNVSGDGTTTQFLRSDGDGTFTWADPVPANSISASELNVSGNGATTQFLRSNGDGTFTWAVPVNTNTTYSAGTGLDLSGTTFSVEPDLRDGLTHVGLNSGDYIQWSDNVYCRSVVNGTERLRVDTAGIDVSGRIVADGDITAFSDARIKENLEAIPNAIEKVESLTGYTYDRTDLGIRQTGLIAQDVLAILPEAVNVPEDPEDMLALNYGALMGLMVEAIKELKAEIEELKK